MDNPAVASDNRDKLVKFWIFGEKGVGKSALVQKFVVRHHFAISHMRLEILK